MSLTKDEFNRLVHAITGSLNEEIDRRVKEEVGGRVHLEAMRLVNNEIENLIHDTIQKTVKRYVHVEVSTSQPNGPMGGGA